MAVKVKAYLIIAVLQGYVFLLLTINYLSNAFILHSDGFYNKLRGYRGESITAMP